MIRRAKTKVVINWSHVVMKQECSKVKGEEDNNENASLNLNVIVEWAPLSRH